jgi:asparagine synthase (glutamine-hydrolysing)
MFISKAEERAELLRQLQCMQRVLLHRGPDDNGIWMKELPNGQVGLASTRLAILDLSAAGHMPMSTPDGRYTIAYNGEIYNYPELRKQLVQKGYRLRSHSDTEAVLYLYQEFGPACVHRLNGMFAIAIWDDVEKQLFLARDHFGVKPLYYAQRRGNLAFASEAKALFELPWIEPELNLQALPEFLNFTWVPDPETMFSGIYKLPAGHYATFRGAELEITRYWDLKFPPADAHYRKTEADLAHEVRERFRRSVRAQMLSDVPLGAFLSGGIDSTSIVAMMAQELDLPVRTYTITFPANYRVGEKTLDDPAVARRAAELYGCEHQEIVVEPDVAELLPSLVWHMDEPIADPASIMAYLVCRKARETATVVLSGIGGDELFAGYRKHCAQRWSEACRRVPLWNVLVNPAISSLPSMRGSRMKGLVRLLKKMARSAALPPRESFLMNCTYFGADQRRQLLRPEVYAAVGGHDPLAKHLAYFDAVSEADFLNQMLYLDTKAFLVSLNLTYNDKMSMASSVEVRVPFLDRELAEFVAQNVPPHMKIKGFFRPTTKHILREAMGDDLPKEVLSQPKANFGAPVDYWLANELRPIVDDLLSESQVRQRGIFDTTAVRQLVQEQRQGRQDWSVQIWQLLTFEVWMQTFFDRTGKRNGSAFQGDRLAVTL